MKTIAFGIDSRKKIKEGIDAVADAVRVTLGPCGRNVILGRSYGNPVITNDGVSIAKEIELDDPLENLGVQLIRQVAEKTNDSAGDGTTTSTVMTQALVREGLKFVETGINPIGIRRGMEAAKDEIISILKKNAQPIKDKKAIIQVATISAESKEMGEMIAEVMYQVGKDGVVTTEQSQTLGLSKEIVEGMKFDKGFISPYMISNTQAQTADIESPYILITDMKISAIGDIVSILEKLAKSGKKDIVIIAEDVDGEALPTLVLNKIRGVLNVLAIKAPEYGEARKSILEDIAILTGATVITSDKGMKLNAVEVNMLGQATKVIATKDTTTIVGGKGKKKVIEDRVKEINAQIAKADSEYDREKLEKRKAKLAGGVAVIRVGAATETELTYMKHKLEDAVNATKAAIDEGIVAGGGCALAHASKKLQSINIDYAYQAGYDTVKNSLTYPLKQIVENSGRRSPDVVLEKVLSKNSCNFGYDAKTDEYETDMISSGIIDPVKVTRMALENAVSVASIFLTTEASVVDDSKPNNDPMV